MPPRSIRPKEEPDTSDSGIIPSDVKANKRRAVSSACLQCRKRKSKVGNPFQRLPKLDYS